MRGGGDHSSRIGCGSALHAVDAFGTQNAAFAVDVSVVLAKSGGFTLEDDFSAHAQHELAERDTMINSRHELPVARRARLLAVARGGACCTPRPASKASLALMCGIDELHLGLLFAGSRMLRDLLRRGGHRIGRKHVRICLYEAVYPRGSRRSQGQWRH